MSIDSKIIAAVASVTSECKPNIYKGTSLEYVVYTYDNTPNVFADSMPDVNTYAIHVHYYLPHGENPRANKKLIAQGLVNQGFTYPTITNASDKDGQHYAFECEGVDGDV